MAISELKQKLLLHELSRLGFRDAAYDPVADKINLEPNNSRAPKINGEGEITYASEYRDFTNDTLWPIVTGVNEAAAAWEHAKAVPVDDVSRFRVLAEYNRVILAARDDTDHGRGFHFVTWQYNPERTGVSHGHYTENYFAAKEDFAVRSGLVPETKLFTKEQAAELKASVEYRIDTSYDLTYKTEELLYGLADQLRAAYTAKATAENALDGIETVPDTDSTISKPPIAQTIYGEVQPGDWIIAAGNSDYGYLIGTVTAIDKLGTPEHGTDNETDDVHVDFTAFDYPQERIAEIEERFALLTGKLKNFSNLPLDDVIMAPKMLIRITHLEHDEITRMGNLRANCEAFCNCFPGAVVPKNAKHAALLVRLEANLTDYRNSLMGFSTRELIDMADKIAAMSDVYSYMCFNDYNDSELDYLLKFQCPLEVVADEWHRRTEDLSDMSFALDEVFDKQDALQGGYALMPDPPAQAAETITPPAKPESTAAKPKTLAEKLQAGKEKAEAYKAQNPPAATKHNKKEID